MPKTNHGLVTNREKRLTGTSNFFLVLRGLDDRRIFRRFASFVVFRVDDSKKNVLPGLEYFETIITKSLKRDDFAERGVVKIPRDI